MIPLIGRRVRRLAEATDIGTVQAVAWVDSMRPPGWRVLVLLDDGARIETWFVSSEMRVLPDEIPVRTARPEPTRIPGPGAPR